MLGSVLAPRIILLISKEVENIFKPYLHVSKNAKCKNILEWVLNLKHSSRRLNPKRPAWYSWPSITDFTVWISSKMTATSLSLLPSMLRSLILAEPGRYNVHLWWKHWKCIEILNNRLQYYILTAGGGISSLSFSDINSLLHITTNYHSSSFMIATSFLLAHVYRWYTLILLFLSANFYFYSPMMTVLSSAISILLCTYISSVTSFPSSSAWVLRPPNEM